MLVKCEQNRKVEIGPIQNCELFGQKWFTILGESVDAILEDVCVT